MRGRLEEEKRTLFLNLFLARRAALGLNLRPA
jgi:hypothetical protein